MYCIVPKEDRRVAAAYRYDGMLELLNTEHAAQRYIEQHMSPSKQNNYTPHPVEVREKRLWGE